MTDSASVILFFRHSFVLIEVDAVIRQKPPTTESTPHSLRVFIEPCLLANCHLFWIGRTPSTPTSQLSFSVVCPVPPTLGTTFRAEVPRFLPKRGRNRAMTIPTLFCVFHFRILECSVANVKLRKLLILTKKRTIASAHAILKTLFFGRVVLLPFDETVFHHLNVRGRNRRPLLHALVISRHRE